MSNMSYCRFQNTAQDLQDCLDALSEAMNGNDESKLSELEAWALLEMLSLAQELLEMIDADEVYNYETLRDAIPEILE